MGLDIDLARRLAESMDVRVKFVEKPFAQLFEALRAGEVDVLISGISITPERNARAAFAGPYFVSGRSVLVKSGNLEQLDELDEINRPAVTLVVLEGSTSQRFVETVVPRAKLVTKPDYEAAVSALLKHKADAMVADHAVCILSTLRHPDADFATLEIPWTLEPIGIAMPPGDFLLHNMIQNYINALVMTGELEELHQRWFEDASWLIRLR
jgi:polar amino acid transport system substrate-binding protein